MKRYAMSIGLSLLLGSACGGCGDEDPPQNQPEEDMYVAPEPDMGAAEPDMAIAVDRDIPGGLLLRMTPGRETYPRGIRLLPEVEVFDAFGDPSDFEWTITVEPDGAARVVDDRFELAEEGVVRFTACTTEFGVDGEPVCGWDEVIVNEGPPTIEIASPRPGAELDSVASPTIDVTGTVTDTFGEPTAFVNGKPVDLDADGAFAATVTPRHGINFIEVAATDGLDGSTSEAVVNVLWAEDYAVAGAPPVQFDDAISLRLGQLFMDDRVRATTAPDGSLVTSDLADILELVIKNLDISSQIPDPVIDTAAFMLRVPSITIGKPLVQIDLVDGGIEIFVQMPALQATTIGDFTFNNTVLDLDGSFSAGMSALIAISIDKASAADPIDVQVESISVAVENATPNFASAEANAIFELASSALRTTVEQLLLDTLQNSFVDEIPALLSDVFVALETALSNQSIDLDTGLGTPVTLNIDGDVQTLQTAFRDHLTATLRLVASTTAAAIHPGSRGQPRFFPVVEPAFFQHARVQFGLRFALVNALLNTLWQSGLLDADVTDAVPVNVDSAQLTARLPPIVRPPLEGEPHDLVIEVGQLEIETDILGRKDRYGVYLATGVDFGLDQGALQVNIGTTPEIRTWLISASEDTPFLSPDALRDLIETQLWPELISVFSDGLSLPLPAPDLSGLGSVAAPLANLMLRYIEVLPLAVRDGWIVLDATMEGTLPP